MTSALVVLGFRVAISGLRAWGQGSDGVVLLLLLLYIAITSTITNTIPIVIVIAIVIVTVIVIVIVVEHSAAGVRMSAGVGFSISGAVRETVNVSCVASNKRQRQTKRTDTNSNCRTYNEGP